MSIFKRSKDSDRPAPADPDVEATATGRAGRRRDGGRGGRAACSSTAATARSTSPRSRAATAGSTWVRSGCAACRAWSCASRSTRRPSRSTRRTAVLEDSALQLQAFAAPRSGRLWDEIRAEIAAAVETQGGTAEEHVGLARRRAAHPDAVRRSRRTHRVRARHLPRRRRAALVPARRAVRPGGHRRGRRHGTGRGLQGRCRRARHRADGPPRAAARCALPRDAEAAAAAETAALDAEDEAERTSLDPFQRGPEITEVR